MPSSGLLEGLTLFAKNTGLIVGRTLVDPSRWKVPVLVSNFSQETIVVDPFTEVGMITQVTAIQCVAEPPQQPHTATGALPRHLQHLVEQTCRDLDPAQRRRLVAVLLKYSDIFPVLSPVIQTQWNMTLIRVIGHPYVVHHGACLLRR